MKKALFLCMVLFASPAFAQADDPLNKEAMEVGAISGVAEVCGLDWEKHFHSFMASKRKQGVAEERMSFVGVFHGVGQQQAVSAKDGECSAQRKADVEKALKANIRKFTR